MVVDPKVEVFKGDTAKLPCSYTGPPSSSNTVVEWYYNVSDSELFMFVSAVLIDRNRLPRLFKILEDKVRND